LGWNLEHVKANPKLLNLPLAFVHANGTVYGIDATNRAYAKACDLSSPYSAPLCPMGKIAANAARDRLVYAIETNWSPPIAEEPFSEGHHVVDAETGEIVWNNIDYAKDRKPMPPNVTFGSNKTINQLLKERVNPPETTKIDIEYGASISSVGKGYLPKEVRVTLGLDNRIVWTNRDIVPESVISDTGYNDKLTGKKFESRWILPNSTFEFTFTEPGEYSYHAEPHPWMRGKIIVVENFS
jgi:plastocyanin